MRTANTPMRPAAWNAELYQSSHSFIWQYGRDLLALLDAKPGERILDVGCGTGQLTDEIAQSGAEVVGIDSSPAMVATARQNFPQRRFEVADVTALAYDGEFDAAVSNAALHWVRDQRAAIASIAGALKPHGRFVFEMGGHGNLHSLLQAVYRSLRHIGVADPERLLPWTFPTIGECAPLLEANGLEVNFAVLFDRPTRLEGGERGLSSWLEMFAGFAINAITPEQRGDFVRSTEQFLQPALFHDGVWTLDYKRLRVVAVKL